MILRPLHSAAAQAHVGCTVCKGFVDADAGELRPFEGVVDAFELTATKEGHNLGWQFHVLYGDGDSEHLDWWGCLLVPHAALSVCMLRARLPVRARMLSRQQGALLAALAGRSLLASL